MSFSEWGLLKFNVDVRVKRNRDQRVLAEFFAVTKGMFYVFSKNVGILDSNEAEVLGILEALRVYAR